MKILLFSFCHQYLGKRTTKTLINTHFYVPYFEVPNHVNSSSTSGFSNLSIIDIWGQITLVVRDCLAYCGMLNSIPDLCSVSAHNILPIGTTKNVFRQDIMQHDPYREAKCLLVENSVIWTFLCHLITFVYFWTVSMCYQKRIPPRLLCRMFHLFKLTNLILKYLHCFLI